MLDFHGAPLFAQTLETKIEEADYVISEIRGEFEEQLEYASPFSQCFYLSLPTI
jgi:hypothetical protein